MSLLHRTGVRLLVLAICALMAVPAAGAAGAKGRRGTRSGDTSRKKADEARRQRSRRPKKAATEKRAKGDSARLAEKRRQEKFARVRAFAGRIENMRTEVRDGLNQPGISFERAVAAVVRIMDAGYVRLGSHVYADPKAAAKKKHGIATYGALSLRKDQVQVDGDVVRFDFDGKAHRVSETEVEAVPWKFELRDPELARAIDDFKRQDSDRPELFVVPDGGEMREVSERRVRTLMRRHGAVPKDLRTYHANRIVAEELARKKPARSVSGRKKQIERAIEKSARALNHDPKVSRKSYVERELLDHYELEGTLGPRGPP